MNILFLCPHGVMKSIMAAAYAQKFALEAGLDLTVVHAGTEPDEIIPQAVIDLLEADGIDIRTWHPNRVTKTDLERANRVISLGCEIPEIQLETWVVPSPSENLIASGDVIKSRVKELILELKAAMLIASRFIPIPNSSEFDHGAFDPITKRIFLAHTAANTLEVLDDSTGLHLKTLPGFPEAAGVVVGGQTVLVTNRGAAELAVIDAVTLEVKARISVGLRPNGVAIATKKNLALVACIGNETVKPTLECIDLQTHQHHKLELPGRPRWCVLDQSESRVFLAIRDPSMVLVAELPDLSNAQCWALPAFGAHGIDIDHHKKRLFVACDAGALIALSSENGVILGEWALPGVPDATFFNPDSGLVHVGVGKPGVVVSVNPQTNRTSSLATELGAGTSALARPNRVFVFLAERGGALELVES